MMSTRLLPWLVPAAVLVGWIVGFVGSASVVLEFDVRGVSLLSDFGGVWVTAWRADPPGVTTGLQNKNWAFTPWENESLSSFLKGAFGALPTLSHESPMNTKGIRVMLPYWFFTVISCLFAGTYGVWGTKKSREPSQDQSDKLGS